MPYIENSKDLRTAVRQGSYAWPGGYPLFFLMDDGGTLLPQTVKDNYRLVLQSVRSQTNDGWRAVGYDVNWESLMYDDHTGEQIPPAYGHEDTL